MFSGLEAEPCRRLLWADNKVSVNQDEDWRFYVDIVLIKEMSQVVVPDFKIIDPFMATFGIGVIKEIFDIFN